MPPVDRTDRIGDGRRVRGAAVALLLLLLLPPATAPAAPAPTSDFSAAEVNAWVDGHNAAWRGARKNAKAVAAFQQTCEATQKTPASQRNWSAVEQVGAGERAYSATLGTGAKRAIRGWIGLLRALRPATYTKGTGKRYFRTHRAAAVRELRRALDPHVGLPREAALIDRIGAAYQAHRCSSARVLFTRLRGTGREWLHQARGLHEAGRVLRAMTGERRHFPLHRRNPYALG